MARQIFLLLALTVCLCSAGHHSSNGGSRGPPPRGGGRPPWDETMEQKFLREVNMGKYLSAVPPPGSAPTNVDTWIQIKCIKPKIEKMGVMFEIFLRNRWVDQRLQHHHDCTLPQTLMDKIWRPDIIIGEAYEVMTPQLPSPARVVKVFRNGTVLQLQRLIVKNICMNMTGSEDQEDIYCPLSLGFIGTQTSQAVLKKFNVYYKTNGKPAHVAGPYRIEGMKGVDCTASYPLSGELSCKQALFHLKKTTT